MRVGLGSSYFSLRAIILLIRSRDDLHVRRQSNWRPRCPALAHCTVECQGPLIRARPAEIRSFIVSLMDYDALNPSLTVCNIEMEGQ